MSRIVTWVFADLFIRMLYESNIIFFDGVCNLCNSLVNFVLRHDQSGSLMFAPLQSEQVLNLPGEYKVAPDGNDSVILITNGRIFRKSGAILHIAKIMGWPWKIFYVFRIIPPFIRDAIYDLIAKYRFRLFGRRDTCMVPGPDVMNRFLT